MSLKIKILDDLKRSLKEQNKKRLKALRMLQSAIKNKEIELRPESITDKEVFVGCKKTSQAGARVFRSL